MRSIYTGGPVADRAHRKTGYGGLGVPLLIGRTGPRYGRQAGGTGFVRLALGSARVWRLAAPLLAAAGLATLALDDSLGFALVAMVAAGMGFAVPYLASSVGMDERQGRLVRARERQVHG